MTKKVTSNERTTEPQPTYGSLFWASVLIAPRVQWPLYLLSFLTTTFLHLAGATISPAFGIGAYLLGSILDSLSSWWVFRLGPVGHGRSLLFESNPDFQGWLDTHGSSLVSILKYHLRPLVVSIHIVIAAVSLIVPHVALFLGISRALASVSNCRIALKLVGENRGRVNS